jgi:hypothetical protein
MSRHRDPAQTVRRESAVEIIPLGDFGHRAGGLSGRQYDQPAGLRRLRQMRRQTGGRMRRRHRGSEKLFEESARAGQNQLPG